MASGFSFYISSKPDLFRIWSGVRTCYTYLLGKDCYNEKQSDGLDFKIIQPKGTESYANMWQLKGQFPFSVTRTDSPELWQTGKLEVGSAMNGGKSSWEGSLCLDIYSGSALVLE